MSNPAELIVLRRMGNARTFDRSDARERASRNAGPNAWDVPERTPIRAVRPFELRQGEVRK